MNKKITAVFIIGIFLTSFGAVLAADGDVIWEKLGHAGWGYDVAVDSKDNIILTYYSGVTKYDPNGNEIWGSPIVYEDAYSVAVDSKDNILVTGGGGTMKYDSNGNPVWGSPISFYGYAVAVDSKDNILVTGGGGTMKYDSNGNPVWGSPISFYGYAVAVDSKDNILVSDTIFNTRKYSSSGTFIWEKTFTTGYSQWSYGVATDSFDNVIVSGYGGNPVSTWASIILKYSPDGTKLWEVIDNIEPRWSYNLAVDSYNNIIVAGGNTSHDWLTKKYDPNGNKIWERAFDFEGGQDEGQALAVDSKNDIVVTGVVFSSGGKYYTVKYQGTPPRSKPLPIAKILEILKRNKNKE